MVLRRGADNLENEIDNLWSLKSIAMVYWVSGCVGDFWWKWVESPYLRSWEWITGFSVEKWDFEAFWWSRGYFSILQLFIFERSKWCLLRLGGLFMITATLFELLTILLISIAPTFCSRDTFYFFLVAIFWRSQFLWSRALFKVWGFFKE